MLRNHWKIFIDGGYRNLKESYLGCIVSCWPLAFILHSVDLRSFGKFKLRNHFVILYRISVG